jgi:hypothetical protein
MIHITTTGDSFNGTAGPNPISETLWGPLHLNGRRILGRWGPAEAVDRARFELAE